MSKSSLIPWAILWIAGLVPALVILFLLRFDQQQLLVAGNPMGDYSLSRLTAGLLSTLTPLLVLLPPAWGLRQEARSISFWLSCVFAPVLLLGPSILAGMIKGGSQPLPSLLALTLLALLSLCFLLWIEWLQATFARTGALLLYGLVWCCSAFLGYLREYVLPYLELGVWSRAAHLLWVFPQLVSGPAAVDGFLNGGPFFAPFWPTLLQIPILVMLLRIGVKQHPSGLRPSP